MTVYQVRINHTIPGGSTDSVMHFDTTGGTAQQAATAAMNFWQSVDNLMHSSCSWSLDTEVRTLNHADGSLTDITNVSAVSSVGTGPGEYQDLLQGLVVWNTGIVLDGRLVRGRTFIPGMTETSNDTTGRPTSAAATAINAAAATLIADASSKFGVWHRPVYVGTGEGRTLDRAGAFVDATTGALKNRWSWLSGRRLS